MNINLLLRICTILCLALNMPRLHAQFYIFVDGGHHAGANKGNVIASPLDYFSLDAGLLAGLPMTNAYVGNPFTGDPLVVENIQASLGEGFTFGGGLGFMFNKHIGIEIGVNYLKSNDIESDYFLAATVSGYSAVQKIEFEATMLTPKAVGKLEAVDRLWIVGKIGPIFEINSNMSHLIIGSGDFGAGQVQERIYTETEGKLTTGLHLSAGAEYKVGKRFYLLAELTYIVREHEPITASLRSYTSGGVSVLNQLPSSFLRFTYQDAPDYNAIFGGTSQSGTPAAKIMTSVSSIGFTAGIRYQLSETIDKKKKYKGGLIGK